MTTPTSGNSQRALCDVMVGPIVDQLTGAGARRICLTDYFDGIPDSHIATPGMVVVILS
jgi:hypothetical protein